MSDNGTLHVCDFDNRVLASFFSHAGGSPCWMLPKLADWRATHPAAPISDLIRWALHFPEQNLTIGPAGQETTGWKQHVYRIRPLADLRADGATPRFALTVVQHLDGRTIETRYEGDEELFTAAAAESTYLANRCLVIARQQQWEPAVRDELGYNPKPFRENAERYAALALAAASFAPALELTLPGI